MSHTSDDSASSNEKALTVANGDYSLARRLRMNDGISSIKQDISETNDMSRKSKQIAVDLQDERKKNELLARQLQDAIKLIPDTQIRSKLQRKYQLDTEIERRRDQITKLKVEKNKVHISITTMQQNELDLNRRIEDLENKQERAIAEAGGDATYDGHVQDDDE